MLGYTRKGRCNAYRPVSSAAPAVTHRSGLGTVISGALPEDSTGGAAAYRQMWQLSPDAAMGNPLLAVVRIEVHDQADHGREGDGMGENLAEDVAFLALLADGRAGDHDGLGGDHFAHDSAGGIGGGHEDVAEAEAAGGDLLEAAEQRVRAGIGAAQGDAHPAEHGAE